MPFDLDGPRDEDGLLHRGLWYGRAVTQMSQQLSLEAAFARRWELENMRQKPLCGVLDALLRQPGEFGLAPRTARRPIPLSQEAATVAATVFQWLGTAQGLSAVVEVLRTAGFVVTDRATGSEWADASRFKRAVRDGLRSRYLVEGTPQFAEDRLPTYMGTVNDVVLTRPVSTADAAVEDALSTMSSGAVIDLLVVRLLRCVRSYLMSSTEAEAHTAVEKSASISRLGETVLSDPDVPGIGDSRERLRRLLDEWHSITSVRTSKTIQGRGDQLVA